MKKIVTLILSINFLLILVACGKTVEGSNFQNAPSESGNTFQTETTPESKGVTENSATTSSRPEKNDTMIDIKISVNDFVFSAKLYDNETSRALTAKFPMTLNMSELNGNEKYYYLPDKLPTHSHSAESINSGDLMLYGSDCLVLFYESFSTSYSYTRIGYMEDVSGLTAALGRGSVQVTFANAICSTT